jgi:hypothetical protein
MTSAASNNCGRKTRDQNKRQDMDALKSPGTSTAQAASYQQVATTIQISRLHVNNINLALALVSRTGSKDVIRSITIHGVATDEHAPKRRPPLRR